MRKHLQASSTHLPAVIMAHVQSSYADLRPGSEKTEMITWKRSKQKTSMTESSHLKIADSNHMRRVARLAE